MCGALNVAFTSIVRLRLRRALAGERVVRYRVSEARLVARGRRGSGGVVLGAGAVLLGVVAAAAGVLAVTVAGARRLVLRVGVDLRAVEDVVIGCLE